MEIAPFEIEHISECQIMGEAAMSCQEFGKTFKEVRFEPGLPRTQQAQALQLRLDWLYAVQNTCGSWRDRAGVPNEHLDRNLTVSDKLVNLIKGAATSKAIESIASGEELPLRAALMEQARWRRDEARE